MLDVIKTVVDSMITNTYVNAWPYEETKFLKEVGELNLGKVPTIASLKPLRAWVNNEAKKAQFLYLYNSNPNYLYRCFVEFHQVEFLKTEGDLFLINKFALFV